MSDLNRLLKIPAMSPDGAIAPHLASAVEQACARIAPTWPLDRLIAVNPWWEMRAQQFADVSARLAALGQVHCVMPGRFYLDLWQQGEMDSASLQAAMGECGYQGKEVDLLAALEHEPTTPHWHNISDLLDGLRDRQHQIAWRDEITHQVSQFCAAHFQHDSPLKSDGHLYAHWLSVTRHDRGIAILMGEPKLAGYFRTLPDSPQALLATAFAELQVEDAQVADYAHALLLDINGWASWVAYERWQARLRAAEDCQMQELLAIRVAWELVLWRYYHEQHPTIGRQLGHLWQRELHSLPHLLRRHQEAQAPIWVWQRAAEIRFQTALQDKLKRAENQAQTFPMVQAVFCIDVRSEVMRRALEAQSPLVETYGFAGFFGLPLAYAPSGTECSRPHLPGLLKPALYVTEVGASADALAPKRAAKLHRAARLQEWSQLAPSTFSVVEALGLGYAWKLVKNTVLPHVAAKSLVALEHGRWAIETADGALSPMAKAKLVQPILSGMNLREFARFVLLIGHGSQTANNPHAAGLDCGACGGQSGELNARVLAELLNDAQVRVALAELGTVIPRSTRFIPALHNTTTDDIHLLDHDHLLPDSCHHWLTNARELAQRERAAALGLSDSGKELDRKLRRRAGDWSEVRPEWGLANNAAIVVAPRSLTRGVDLQGRCFLHEYDWRCDAGFATLEQIMTAPVVVAHWINMQYNASVTDPVNYGSGNKVLHNVVGGHIGVFEGNGGDLRIGLPLQSVHDGERWMHQPLRLSAVVAAPRDALLGVIQKHAVLQQLFHNGWVFCLRWDDETKHMERYDRRGWRPVGVGRQQDPGRFPGDPAR